MTELTGGELCLPHRPTTKWEPLEEEDEKEESMCMTLLVALRVAHDYETARTIIDEKVTSARSRTFATDWRRSRAGRHGHADIWSCDCEVTLSPRCELP